MGYCSILIMNKQYGKHSLRVCALMSNIGTSQNSVWETFVKMISFWQGVKVKFCLYKQIKMTCRFSMFNFEKIQTPELDVLIWDGYLELTENKLTWRH